MVNADTSLPDGTKMLSIKIEKCDGGPDVDAIYIKVLQGRSVKREALGKTESIILDFDVEDKLLGIEIIQLDDDTEALLASIVDEYEIDALRGHFKINKLREVFA